VFLREARHGGEKVAWRKRHQQYKVGEKQKRQKAYKAGQLQKRRYAVATSKRSSESCGHGRLPGARGVPCAVVRVACPPVWLASEPFLPPATKSTQREGSLPALQVLPRHARDMLVVRMEPRQAGANGGSRLMRYETNAAMACVMVMQRFFRGVQQTISVIPDFTGVRSSQARHA